MLLTRPPSWTLAIPLSLLAVLILLAMDRGPAAVQTAAASAGASYCTGELEPTRYGGLEGTCTAPFQGFPVGVAGTVEAATADVHTHVHVEVFAQLSTGFARPLGIECEQEGYGTASCEHSRNPFGTPLTAPEPVPAEIIALSCRAHSHAHGTNSADATGGTFACWSTEEASQALAYRGF